MTTRRPMIAADDPRHGTDNAYRNLGCRCDRCRDAHSDYERGRLDLVDGRAGDGES